MNLMSPYEPDIHYNFSECTTTTNVWYNKCQFPFNYKGVTYRRCTEIGHPGKPWGATRIDPYTRDILVFDYTEYWDWCSTEGCKLCYIGECESGKTIAYFYLDHLLRVVSMDVRRKLF